MPFALAIIGIILLIAGVRGKQDVLFSTVKGDFTGPNNFIFWMVSIFVIGAIGYIPKLKPVSTAFLALVIVVLFLRKGTGFFAQAQRALNLTTSTTLNPNVINQPVTPGQPITNPGGYPGLQNLQPLGGIQ